MTGSEADLAADPDPQTAAAPAPALTFDPRMLESLVCPATQTTLSYDAASQELVSKSAGLAFPIRDGIPIMLLSEARKLG